MVYVKWRILENVGIPRVKVTRQVTRGTRRSVLTRSLRDYHKGSSDPKPYCSLRKVLGVRGNITERPVFSYIRIVNVARCTRLPPSAMYLRTN
jgi:hypothetical protein